MRHCRLRLSSSAPSPCRSPRAPLVPRALVALTVGVLALATARTATAQPSTQARTILVDEGGSYQIPVHPDFVTVLYLPDKVEKALASDAVSYEVKPIASTTIAIRPLRADARPASLSLSTATIRVSLVLEIAARREDALTQVTFKRADVEAEVQRRIDEGVRARTAELEAKIADMQKAMDAELPRLADGLIAARLLVRHDVRKLTAIERNDDDVIVEVTRAIHIGEDAYLAFTIQNRATSPYRLARVALQDGASDRAGLTRFVGDAAEVAGPGVLGVIRPGGRGQGVVLVRAVAALRGRALTLVVTQPDGRGKVAVGRIVLR